MRVSRKVLVGAGALALVLAGIYGLDASASWATSPGLPGSPPRVTAGSAVRLPMLSRSAEPPSATPRPPSPVPARMPSPTSPAPTSTPIPGPAPDGLVIVASGKAQAVTLVDATTDKATETISLGVPIANLAIQPDGRQAWVFSTRSGESDFYQVNLQTGELPGSKRLRDSPRAAAFSRDGARAFVALWDGNAVSFLNATNRDEIGRVDLGRQSAGVGLRRRPAAMVSLRRPSGEALFVAGQGSGVVWALDEGSGKLLAEIEVGGGPGHLVAGPDGRNLYVVTDTLNQLVVIDPATLLVSARIALPGPPAGAAIDARRVIYVAEGNGNGVWLVDPAGQKVLARLQVGRQPSGIAASADGERIYVTNRADGTLSVIDAATRRVVDTVPVGTDPVAVAFARRPRQRPAAPTKAPSTRPATPTSTPTMVPTPTPLPPNTKPPDHLPPGTRRDTFVPHAASAVGLAFAPDGRLFYNEVHTGKVRVVQDGKLLPDPFYTFAVSGEPEAGLLGLALDPNFARNHYVYVFYTSVAGGGTTSGGANGPNRVVRLTDVQSRGTSLTPILRDLPSGPIHNAGTIRFGPDGKLYVSIGDNDNGNNAQDLRTLAGKILRVNPDGSIPADNPFVGKVGALPAIWAYGLRNSFSFDFQPISHGLFATENGPGDNDEINLIVKGGNYGWPPSGFQDKPGLIDPLMVMNPPIAPTGAAFYVGRQIPEWQNELFYCNYHQAQLRRIHLVPGSFDRIVSEEIVADGCTLDVASGPDGALYFSGLDAIYRIRPANAPALPSVAGSNAPKSTPTETLPAGMHPQDRDVGVSLSEWKLTPSRKVVPAGTIRFLAENLGDTPHALRILGHGIDVATEEFGPGQSRSLEVKLPPGTYQLSCPIGNHAQMGMVATITVVGR